jgi:predicted aspartyl protease
MVRRGLLVLCLCAAVCGQGTKKLSAGTDASALARAYALLDQQNFKQAAAAFAELAKSNPTDTEGQLGLIRALFETGEFEAAERAAERAAQLNLHSGPIHAALADVYFRLGLFDLAELQYKTAVALQARLARAWIGLGRIYSIRSMASEARRAFRNAGESNPKVRSQWLTGLSSSEQLSTYREYVVNDESQSPARCEVYSASLEKHKNQEIPLKSIVDGNGSVRAVGLKALINDRAPVLLMLDTGASGITIGSDLAKKAGILLRSHRPIYGMGGSGETHGQMARVTSIRIGTVELRNCMIQIAPDRKILSQDGIIGADVFRKYPITMDFERLTLSLSERDGPGNKSKGSDTAIHAYQFAHFILVPAKLGQHASGLFVLDSGANADTISEKLSSKVGGMVSRPRFIEGSSGVVNSALGTDSAIMELGNISLSDQTVAAIDLSSLSKRLGAEVAGQIGFIALKHLRLKLDYETDTVYLSR